MANAVSERSERLEEGAAREHTAERTRIEMVDVVFEGMHRLEREMMAVAETERSALIDAERILVLNEIGFRVPHGFLERVGIVDECGAVAEPFVLFGLDEGVGHVPETWFRTLDFRVWESVECDEADQVRSGKELTGPDVF